MMRWLLPLVLAGCVADLEQAPGPDFGKADGTDSPDHECRIILRQLDGLPNGRIDVDAALVDDGARPAVLVSFDGRTFFAIDHMTETAGGVTGYQRFAFAIDVPSGQSDDRVQVIPFLKHHGNRIFDHNRHPADNENYVAEKATGHQIALDEQTCPAKLDRWHPLVELRDDSAMFPGSKPAGGWWVTPIHATLLADGKVLVTGWGRHDRDDCGAGGSRKNGVTFVLDPADLDATRSLNVQPIDEQPLQSSDVLYCAGHAPLPDGRILYAGGSHYEGLGTPTQLELGLDYARVFDPATRSFQRLAQPLTGGRRWYPTTTRLGDGRVLVTGGFTQCCSTQFANLSIEVFDPAADAFSMLVTQAQSAQEIGSSIKDFPRVFALPGSGGVAILGAAGRVMRLDPDVGGRLTSTQNAQRAGGATAEDATVAMVSTGEIMVVGGSPDGRAAQRADLYDPAADRWRSIDTGISRYNAASVLLPDGTALVVNGDGGNDGDRRRAQVIDPRTGSVTTMLPWSDDTGLRGYHSFALLLKDGRVLVGGGTNSAHGIGCERPDLRIYEPGYLHKGERPAIAQSELTLVAGGTADIDVTGDAQTAVLMAVGSFTHGFDQNQRYIELAADRAPGRLTLHAPSAAQAPPGDYMLFVVSAAGVPSVGVHVALAN